MNEYLDRPRIYADFAKYSGDPNDKNSYWLILTCRGTWEDLAKNNIQLSEGLKLLFYCDDGDEFGNLDELEVEGVCHFDSTNNYWIALIDWNGIYHVSEKKGRVK